MLLGSRPVLYGAALVAGSHSPTRFAAVRLTLMHPLRQAADDAFARPVLLLGAALWRALLPTRFSPPRLQLPERIPSDALRAAVTSVPLRALVASSHSPTRFTPHAQLTQLAQPLRRCFDAAVARVSSRSRPCPPTGRDPGWQHDPYSQNSKLLRVD
jgi:hypothetical protein